MKASMFTDAAQKAFVIKQTEDGTSVAEVWRKAGISTATFFNWRKNTRPDGIRDEVAQGV